MEMSQHTVIGKYINITEIVMLSIMKELFSKLLFNTTPTMFDKFKYRPFLKENPDVLFAHIGDKKAVVVHPFDPAEIKVLKHTGIEMTKDEYPLDDVDDVLEWNVLLNNKFFGYGTTMITRSVNVTITKNSKDIVLNFAEYNAVNNKNGEEIYREIIDQQIDPVNEI